MSGGIKNSQRPCSPKNLCLFTSPKDKPIKLMTYPYTRRGDSLITGWPTAQDGPRSERVPLWFPAASSQRAPHESCLVHGRPRTEQSCSSPRLAARPLSCCVCEPVHPCHGGELSELGTVFFLGFPKAQQCSRPRVALCICCGYKWSPG